jgi:DME family drug/metabolite transporter
MDKHYWLVIICGISSGVIVFGGKVFADMGLSLYQISVIPIMFGILMLSPYILAKGKYRVNREMLLMLAFFGLIIAMTILPQYGAVIMGTPVAVTVLLLYTQPVWTMIFSRFILKETITKAKIIAVLIVLAGVVFIINPLHIESLGSLNGILVALTGGFFLSGWTVVGSVLGKRDYDPFTTNFFSSIFALIFLLASLPVMSHFVSDPAITSLSVNLPLKVFLYLALFQIIGGLIPQITYYAGAKKVSTTDAGVILLLEPVSGSILAAVFLGQGLTANILVGGTLILLANYIVIREKDEGKEIKD